MDRRPAVRFATPGNRNRPTIVSRKPIQEPDSLRNTSGPGYSGTDTVQRKDAAPESAFKVGQILVNQPAPLVVNGKTEQNPEEGKYEGKSWEKNQPIYTEKKQVSEGFFRAASEYEKVSKSGLNKIKEHEGVGATTAIPGGVFDNVCKTGMKMIGYGHVLTAQEMSEPFEIRISGVPDWEDNPRVIQATVNWKTSVLTEDQATILLQNDLKPIYSKVKSSLGGARITQDQFDALVDFVFNVGSDAFDKSGIAGFISGGRYDEVPTEMVKWILACGKERSELKARRIDNACLFAGTLRASVFSAATDNTPSSATTSDRAARAMAWFQSAEGGGFTRAQAAGIVGNLIQESSLNPGITGPGNAQGIAQWTPTGGRQARVATYLGRPITQADFDSQLRAITWELTTTEATSARLLRNTSNTDDAARVFNDAYERSGRPEYAKRIANARAVFNNANIP